MKWRDDKELLSVVIYAAAYGENAATVVVPT